MLQEWQPLSVTEGAAIWVTNWWEKMAACLRIPDGYIAASKAMASKMLWTYTKCGWATFWKQAIIKMYFWYMKPEDSTLWAQCLCWEQHPDPACLENVHAWWRLCSDLLMMESYESIIAMRYIYQNESQPSTAQTLRPDPYYVNSEGKEDCGVKWT